MKKLQRDPHFEVFTDHDKKIVRITIRDQVDKDSVSSIISQSRDLASQNSYPILYDIRFYQLKASIADIFFITRLEQVNADSDAKKVRIALLVSKDHNLKKYRFYEETAAKANWPLKVFIDENEGIEWLNAVDIPYGLFSS